LAQTEIIFGQKNFQPRQGEEMFAEDITIFY